MEAVAVPGKQTYVINLGCGTTADYTGCSPNGDPMVFLWYSSPFAVSARITVRSASGCTGTKRPVLSSPGTTELLTFYDPGYAILNNKAVFDKTEFRLQNLIIDGTGTKKGILVLSPNCVQSYAQTNVNVINTLDWGLQCIGCGKFAVSGGRFADITFTDTQFSTGAGVSYYDTGAGGASSQGSLSVSKATFSGNKAGYGSAVAAYVSWYKVSGGHVDEGKGRVCFVPIFFSILPPKQLDVASQAAKINIKSCTFDGNIADGAN
jgi:hypothetical protein